MKLTIAPALLAVVCAFGFAAPLAAQVTLKRAAVVFCGSQVNTTAPAVVDEAKCREATREWQKIQSEGIECESAQGKQLLQAMNSKVREAVKSIAADESRDLVVRKDDITDKRGKDVVDLTDKVVAKLAE